MRIGVLGASVSAQTLRHNSKEVVGYVEFLRRHYMADISVTEIRQFTYPGNRLGDAGLIKLGALLTYRPDICLFEPLVEDVTRGSEADYGDYLGVYDALIANGILPVTLALPWPPYDSRRKIAFTVERLCATYDLPLIQMRIPADADTDAMFADQHTNASGGDFYAANIAHALRAIGAPAQRLEEIRARWNVPNSRAIARSVAMHADEFRTLQLDVTFPAGGLTRFRLLQRQKIGPFSPLYQLVITDRETNREIRRTQLSAWDPWCHFVRFGYTVLADDYLTEQSIGIEISTLPSLPDYSQSRRIMTNWSTDPAELHFKPAGPIWGISSTEFSLSLKDASLRPRSEAVRRG